MPTLYYATIPSPIGPLWLAATDQGLCQIVLPGKRADGANDEEPSHIQQPRQTQRQARRQHPVLSEAKRQLDRYFAGALREFTLPLAPQGTPFQLRVWQALETIPYGQTVSYAELAAHIGRPKAVRAVGGANGRNPLPLVRACHRVIGSDGSLTGFTGGLAAKRWLLHLECPARWA